MNKVFAILIVLLTAGVSVQAQTFSQYVSAAEEAVNGKDYYSAMSYYKEALAIQPKRTDIRFKYAEAARLINAYEAAIAAYQQVAQSKKEGEYPLTTFWLAELHQKLGKYAEAQEMYTAFLTANLGNEDVPTYYIQKAEKEKAAVQWASEKVLTPTSAEVVHLGTAVNSQYSEYGAFIKGDTLFYTSFKYPNAKDQNPSERLYNKLLISVKDADGNLTEGELFSEINETERHTAHTAFNTNNSRLYYTICDYKEKTGAEIICNIYYREKQANGAWGSPVRLPESINMAGYTTTHPNIGFDQDMGTEVLYFASDRPGGKGDLDIWYSQITPSGEFLAPQKLDVVNTRENDITPFFHTPTQTLYFSSEGHQGLGAYDIYKVKKQGGTWGPIENMNTPINSSFNDIYFALNEDGSQAYFSSNRYNVEEPDSENSAMFLDDENKICCNDLYSAEFDTDVEFLALTFDDRTKDALVGATVQLLEILSDGREIEIGTNINPLDNTHPFTVKRGHTYVIRALKDGYIPLETKITIDEDSPDKVTEELYLKPILIDLQALTFDLDTELPLAGATVSIREIDPSGEENIEQQTNEIGNDFVFPLKMNKRYLISATKPGYEPLEEELEFNTNGLTQSETFKAELFLKRTSFSDYLPLAIYFDNDIPDRNSMTVTTKTKYNETVPPYLERKEEYIREYTAPMSEEDKFLTTQRYEAFFEREVSKGYEDLKAFSDELIAFLEQSPKNTVAVRLKGYASPRANSDYNFNLSKRRIVSVENFFRYYQNGVFLPYLQNGQLRIEEEPFGESAAPNFVSDLIKDTRASIYSLDASLERRVEVVEVETMRAEGEPETNLSNSNSRGALKR